MRRHDVRAQGQVLQGRETWSRLQVGLSLTTLLHRSATPSMHPTTHGVRCQTAVCHPQMHATYLMHAWKVIWGLLIDNRRLTFGSAVVG